ATVRALYEEELAATKVPARQATLARELGLLHARRGEAEAAAPLLERALALAPDDGTRERLAEGYAALGEPRPGSLCVELAAARRKAGDLEGAATFYRRALGVDPGSGPACSGLEEVLGALGRWAELERLYEQLGAPELLPRRARLLVEKLGDR